MTGEPLLRGRVLIAAFEGWNDAGEAASGAVRRLRDELSLVPAAELDPEDYFDYQFSRPVVTLGDDGERRILWPGVTFFAPEVEGATNVHLLLGTEPSRMWKTFAAEVLEMIESHEIDLVVFLGAMLADVPHTRPISTFASGESPEIRETFGVERSEYEGPTGILGVLADTFERAGIPTLSVWASVPHYVHNSPSPKATLALLDRLQVLLGIEVPRDELVAESAEWESGIDQLADDDEEMATYIETLERQRDTVDSPEASGDSIADEFEKYLRRHNDESR